MDSSKLVADIIKNAARAADDEEYQRQLRMRPKQEEQLHIRQHSRTQATHDAARARNRAAEREREKIRPGEGS